MECANPKIGMGKLFFIVVLSVIIVSGCIGGKKNDETNTGTTTIEEKPIEDMDEATTQDNAKAILMNIFESPGEYKVVYEMSIKETGGKIMMTIYMNGKDKRTGKYRGDFYVQGFEARTYMVDGMYHNCNNESGLWSCVEFKLSEMPDPQQNILDNLQNYDVEQIQDRTIAGEAVECYRIIVEEDSITEYCFNATNIPLYIKIVTPQMTTETIAQDFEKDITDDVFRLPNT